MSRAGDIRRRAGRTLLVGFEGTELDTATSGKLRRLSPGGVILFRRNLDSPELLTRLHGDLLCLLPEPTLIALDQEGGRVSRLEPWVGPTPPMGRLARSGEGAVWEFGAGTGSALRALGFNVDLAPVVDLCPAGAPNGIGDRSFGTDPARVTSLAGAFLDGLQSRGLAGCLKHFPGLGDTRVDSHVELPTCSRDLARIEAEDLMPFRRLGPKAASVLVGHGHYPALDPDSPQPATLSPVIVTEWLRRRLGFPGLVLTDDMEMGAVATSDVEGRAGVAAVGAGCDLVIYGRDLDAALRAREALAEEALRNPSFESRLRDASERVVRTAARWPVPRPDLIAWERARDELVAPDSGEA